MKPDLTWLENPEVFRVNRLDAHSDHHFYETEEDMQEKRETLRQSLNGEWDFCWSRNYKERPENFFEADTELEGFEKILVPGHMELQGYDRIQYINTTYPWEGHCFLRPPHIDWEHNPVGSYVREFDLNKELIGKRVCVSFQGVEQAMYVWCNGTFIGYAEDTFTPSEFDLTDVIREKDNRLCVEVYKRSSAAWIEDQDFFRFSGIFRDVYLYGKPDIHMEDLWIRTGLKEDLKTGTLEIEAKISGACGQVLWTMMDQNGKIVAEGDLKKSETGSEKGTSGEVISISEVHKWDMKSPYLYRIVLTLVNEKGQSVEFVPYKTGFRRFEMKEKIMYLNGERLIINGVNRHEWSPRSGRSITEEEMRTDIEIMKRNNINAVRTCHYPDQSLWYELCDEAGICVMDETNLESHGSWQKGGLLEPSWNVPGSRPEWKACVLDRAASMLERDKNHVAILWWSCGNESYAGEDILAMSQYFHEKDPSRLVHYEGCFWNREFDQISDVESRMYATPEAIREYLENDPKKPFILCEYMHDMGNSIGGMESYIRLLDEFPMYQGGFIWDYIDQALYYRNRNGEEVLGYGGDFGERPTDYAFSANGIVFADRTEKPAMQEVRYWYMNRADRERFRKENEHLRAKAQEELKKKQKKEPSDKKKKAFSVVHSDLYLGVKGEGFHVIFSWDAGPVSLVYDGCECLYRAPKPAFWRASTENDKGNGFDIRSAVWMSADRFSRCTGCTVEEYAPDRIDRLKPSDMAGRAPAAEDLEKVKISYTFETGTVPATTVDVSYTVDSDGKIHVEMTYHGRKDLPQLPLFGLRFLMADYTESVTWQGLSGETYPDRMKGARFGIHKDKIEVSDYLVPQECKNHMDTCWAKTGNLKIVMDQTPFHFSAIPYTPQELENAFHKEELSRPVRTVVTVLAKMRGVGGIDSWGSDVEPAYQISSAEDITCSFYLERA